MSGLGFIFLRTSQPKGVAYDKWVIPDAKVKKLFKIRKTHIKRFHAQPTSLTL